MTICPLWGCPLAIIVTVKDIRVVDGHHCVAANFDGQILHDGATQLLNHSPDGIFAGKRDRECQPRGPGDNHIVFHKLKYRDFLSSSLSTYDFSTLYTTLPHNLIKDKLVDLIERTLDREGSLYIACNNKNAFFTSDAVRNYNLWSCQKVC